MGEPVVGEPVAPAVSEPSLVSPSLVSVVSVVVSPPVHAAGASKLSATIQPRDAFEFWAMRTLKVNEPAYRRTSVQTHESGP